MIYGNQTVEKVYREQIHPMLEVVFQRLLADARSGNQDSVLYKHHIDYIQDLTHYYSDVQYADYEPEDMVVDYIASMTDDYFIDLYNFLFPKGKYKVDYIGYFDKLSES